MIAEKKLSYKNKLPGKSKKNWNLWLTSITPSGIITELSQIIVFKKQTIKKNFRKMKSQLTKDRRYDKVSESPTKRQQNLNSKMFEKT